MIHCNVTWPNLGIEIISAPLQVTLLCDYQKMLEHFLAYIPIVHFRRPSALLHGARRCVIIKIPLHLKFIPGGRISMHQPPAHQPSSSISHHYEPLVKPPSHPPWNPPRTYPPSTCGNRDLRKEQKTSPGAAVAGAKDGCGKVALRSPGIAGVPWSFAPLGGRHRCPGFMLKNLPMKSAGFANTTRAQSCTCRGWNGYIPRMTCSRSCLKVPNRALRLWERAEEQLQQALRRTASITCTSTSEVSAGIR